MTLASRVDPSGHLDPRRLAGGAPASWIVLRIALAGGLLLVLLAAIAYRAYGIQVRDAESYREKAEEQHSAVVRIPAPRGGIYDRAGVELAVTADIDSIYAVPREIERPLETAGALGEVLEINEETIAKRLDTDRHFAWVDRHVTTREAQEVKELELEGVDLTSEPRRYYPARATTGPVLGFANIDGDGLDGVELSMNDLLRGRGGEIEAIRDAQGRLAIKETPVVAEPGAELALTLDRTIQHAAHTAVKEAVESHDARSGTAVVLDVETGGILAMANAPSYDPNEPTEGLDNNARNRAVADAHEPGSLLKVFLVAAALEEGAADPDTTLDVEGGELEIGNHTVRDTFDDDELDLGGIIRRSSNVGAVKLARRLGEEAYERALRRYGFAEPTDIELPGERAGRLRPHESWREIEFATLAYGYGMMATPLQIAAGMAAIGNGGVYHPPRLVEEAIDPTGEPIFERSLAGERVMDREVAEALLPMLASVFRGGSDGGTARQIQIDGYRAGGKTGTALKVHPEGGYYDDVYVSSFAGLAPIDDPRIALVVLIDEPGGDHFYGGRVAGPAFAEIVSQSLRYLGVPPAEDAGLAERAAGVPQRPRAPDIPDPSPPLELEWDADEDGDARAKGGDRDGRGLGALRMPDVRGLGVSRALGRAEEACADVEISGTGIAKSQEPGAGAPISGPTRCRIDFGPRGPNH